MNFFSILAVLLCFQLNANAISVGIYDINNASTADVDVSLSVTGTIITISETWNSLGSLFLEIEGLDSESPPRTNYTVIKEIKNLTGFGWTSFANELLDPAGDKNDDQDPLPYPAFVPADYSTSNDKDGLSFAQGSGLPRTSSIFDEIFVDEESDARDFIDFFGETWLNGEFGTITYGLSDTGPNQPFLLAQRPNEFSASEPVPEPATMLLVGSGLVGLLGYRRKFKKS